MTTDPATRKPREPRLPRAPRPLDPALLQDLALGYAARYATTAAKLRRYLTRKLQERGWQGESAPDIDALIARLTALAYVDDRAWAQSRARDLTARGLGARRIAGALASAGVDKDDRPQADPETRLTTAIAFARRRRLGPFARDAAPDAVTDPRRRTRELAAMARAGHDFDVARRVLSAPDEAALLALETAEATQ